MDRTLSASVEGSLEWRTTRIKDLYSVLYYIRTVFLIFINDLDQNVSSSVLKFADNTKLWLDQ